MKERPILFSAPMVRAILAGAKTQTRRVIKPQPPSVDAVRALSGGGYSWFTDHHSPGVFRVAGPVWAVRELGYATHDLRCPYRVVGDRLWVRETFALVCRLAGCEREDVTQPHDEQGVRYRATWEKTNFARWRPSIHMPRWASRLVLEVTDVRVEPLQAISEEDARAEGVDPIAAKVPTYRDAFSLLWDEINGGRASWTSNPWLWVVSFRRVEAGRAAA